MREPAPEGTGRLLPYRTWEAEVVLRTAGWIAALRGTSLLVWCVLASTAGAWHGWWIGIALGGGIYLISGLALHHRWRLGWFGCLTCALSWWALLTWVGFSLSLGNLELPGFPDLWNGGFCTLLAAPALIPDMVVVIALASPRGRSALLESEMSAELAPFRTVRSKRISARILAAWAALLVAHVTTAAALFITPGCFAD